MEKNELKIGEIGCQRVNWDESNRVGPSQLGLGQLLGWVGLDLVDKDVGRWA